MDVIVRSGRRAWWRRPVGSCAAGQARRNGAVLGRPNIPPYPERLKKSQALYNASVRVRWRLLRPLVRLLCKLGVSANAVSYVSTLLMVPILFVSRDYPWLAVACVGGSVFVDLVDGLVARESGTASDRGKLVDMVCDNLAFTIFMIGLARNGLVSAVPAVLLTYTMVTSKVLRSVVHGFLLDTDWRFKAVAGVLPNVAVAIEYLALLLYAATGLEWLEPTALVLGVILAIDTYVFYRRLLRELPVTSRTVGPSSSEPPEKAGPDSR